MGMEFNINTNAKDARLFFDGFARDQVPYATSRAINRLAWDLREEAQDDLGKYFNLRTNWLTKKGAMPVHKSHKNQMPDIHAIIGVKDEVAAMAITGGTRATPGGAMSVPFSNVGAGSLSTREILNPGRETLPRSKWPSNIVKERKVRTRRAGRNLKAKPFYIKSNKTGKTYVALRSSVSRFPLQILYGFEDSVKVPKSWPLIEQGESFVGANYDDYLYQEIDNAIASMRV